MIENYDIVIDSQDQYFANLEGFKNAASQSKILEERENERTREVQENLDAVVEELRLAKEELKEAKYALTVHKCDALDAQKATFAT